MKYTLLVFLLLAASIPVYSQGYFQMNKDLGDGTISYRDTILTDSLNQEETLQVLENFFAGDVLEIETESINGVEQTVSMLTLRCVGKKSDLGAAYSYIFTCKMTIDIKDNKIRYTFNEFKKKSSPGEPGMTMEAYIDSYKPKISSDRSRERYALRLDEIELALHEQVSEVIYNLKNQFEKDETEW